MADHKQSFFERWFHSTNHKDIGTLYLLFALLMFFIGGAMAMVHNNGWRMNGTTPVAVTGQMPRTDIHNWSRGIGSPLAIALTAWGRRLVD